MSIIKFSITAQCQKTLAATAALYDDGGRS
mgnify:CR=1 FL=1